MARMITIRDSETLNKLKRLSRSAGFDIIAEDKNGIQNLETLSSDSIGKDIVVCANDEMNEGYLDKYLRDI